MVTITHAASKVKLYGFFGGGAHVLEKNGIQMGLGNITVPKALSNDQTIVTTTLSISKSGNKVKPVCVYNFLYENGEIEASGHVIRPGATCMLEHNKITVSL